MTEFSKKLKNYSRFIASENQHNAPSPNRILEVVRGIQYHQVALHRKQSAKGLTTLTPEQKDLFDTVNLPKPSKIAL